MGVGRKGGGWGKRRYKVFARPEEGEEEEGEGKVKMAGKECDGEDKSFLFNYI